MQILSRAPKLEYFRMASSRVGSDGGIALSNSMMAGEPIYTVHPFSVKLVEMLSTDTCWTILYGKTCSVSWRTTSRFLLLLCLVLSSS